MKLIRIGWLLVVVVLFSLTLPGQELGHEGPDPRPYTPPRQVDRPVSVPRLIRFGGTLKDAAGKPRTGQVAVQFAIYREERDESALWTEIQNVLADEKGQYTVLLGTASPEGIPLELFATAEQRWLGVRVADPGESEQPRALLVSVPYALKAGDAETLGGMPASQFLLRPQADSAYSAAAGAAVGLPSSAITITPPTATVSGTGTTNKVTKWTDTVGTLGDSSIFDNGTGVGVNTTAPDTKLTVNGPSDTPLPSGNRHYYNVAEYNYNAVITGTLIITLPKYGSNTMLNIRIVGYDYSYRGAWEILIGGYNYSDHVWYNRNLELKGTPPFTQIRLANNGTNDLILLGTTSTQWTYPKVLLTDVITAFSNTSNWGTGWSTTVTASEPTLFNVVTVTPKTFVDINGNLGIGTTSPQTRLDVSAVAYGRTASFGAGGFDTRFDLGDGLTVSSIFNANNAYSLLGRNVYYDGAFKHSLDTSAGYSTGAYIQLARSGDISFGQTTDGNTAKDSAATLHDNVTFLAGGNVGIGTSAPSQKLEVAGNVKVTGTAGVDGIIFPDGTVQTTACGSLAFGAPGQVQALSSFNTGDKAVAQISTANDPAIQALLAVVQKQQAQIDQLRTQLDSLKGSLKQQ